MEDVMSPAFHLIMVTAMMAALQGQAWAQENTAPPQPPAQEPGQPSAQPSQPQESAPASSQDSDNRRFTLHRIEGGFLRLDMRTGAVDSCNLNGAVWTCVAGRDERAALDREIAKLQRDNAVLKNALLERGVPLPDGMAPNPPASAGGWSGRDETIPRPPQTVPPTAAAPGSPAQGASPDSGVMDAAGKGWRRLVEMMTNLQRELEK
jgi:hypothetical protein